MTSADLWRIQFTSANNMVSMERVFTETGERSMQMSKVTFVLHAPFQLHYNLFTGKVCKKRLWIDNILVRNLSRVDNGMLKYFVGFRLYWQNELFRLRTDMWTGQN